MSKPENNGILEASNILGLKPASITNIHLPFLISDGIILLHISAIAIVKKIPISDARIPMFSFSVGGNNLTIILPISVPFDIMSGAFSAKSETKLGKVNVVIKTNPHIRRSRLLKSSKRFLRTISVISFFRQHIKGIIYIPPGKYHSTIGFYYEYL